MATFEELANKLENHSKETVIQLLYNMTKTAKEWKLRYEQAEQEKVQIRTDAEKEIKKIKQHDTPKVYAMQELMVPQFALDKAKAKLEVAEMTLKEVQDENDRLKTTLRRYDPISVHEDSDIEQRRKAARFEKESVRMREADELQYRQREDRISKKREDIEKAEKERQQLDHIAEISQKTHDTLNA
jgi:hypothetical protein